MARSGWQGANWGPGGSRTLKPDLELLDPMAIILSIPRTFMGLSLGGAVNPGRDHGVEKSVFINRLNNRPESLKNVNKTIEIMASSPIISGDIAAIYLETAPYRASTS